ncbi:MAG: MBL fold metallo-hydrolase [bacterium]
MPRKSITKLSLLFFCIFCAVVWTFASLRPHYAAAPALDAWVLDVGQGESVLIHEPSGKKILYDGGPDDSVLTQLGDVVPAWDRSIDLVILSHNHSDHLRGLITVLQRYTVKEIWVSGALYATADFRAFQKEISQHQVPVQTRFFKAADCVAGTPCPPTTVFGQLTLQVYHPLTDMTGSLPGDQHDATVSVKVSFHGESLFLIGDLNETHEKQMLETCPPPDCTLSATVLQTPHHGSATGLSPPFLAAVAPQVAVIPVGLKNSYGHPAPSTIAKLAAAHIPTYRTDTQGRIHLVLYGDHFTVETEKP